MEEIFSALIILIGAIVSIISAAKKEKEKQAAQAQRQEAAAARVRAAQERSKAAAEKPAPTPAAPTVQRAQPLVHPHIQPDCETHDAPGSLGTVSTEGKDPCHEPMLTHARTPQEDEPEQPALTFDWSGENLVKAFVMQEILTRPAQRQVR